jgi:hypothetical protein
MAMRKESPNNLTFAQAETDELYAVRWAELPSSIDLQVEALGFPDAEFSARRALRRPERKIAGKVFGGANLIAVTQGLEAAIVQVSSCAEQPGGLAGISGAAVFERAGALVAVIVVLIFDYVERTPRFIEILRQLDDLFDEPQNLRFVANCRHRCVGVADRHWDGPISFVIQALLQRRSPLAPPGIGEVGIRRKMQNPPGPRGPQLRAGMCALCRFATRLDVSPRETSRP